MAKANIAQIPGKLYDLLKELEPDERKRVVAATMMLFGETTPLPPTSTPGAPKTAAPTKTVVPANGEHTPKSYMDEKEPQNKSEALAVAARYRELYEGAETHTKEEIKNIFIAARRNFDDNNYARDVKNARNQSGYFNKSTAKGSDTLSYYGQNYVDALPDRDAAKSISRPKIRTKATSKKKSKTKPKK